MQIIKNETSRIQSGQRSLIANWESKSRGYSYSVTVSCWADGTCLMPIKLEHADYVHGENCHAEATITSRLIFLILCTGLAHKR